MEQVCRWVYSSRLQKQTAWLLVETFVLMWFTTWDWSKSRNNHCRFWWKTIAINSLLSLFLTSAFSLHSSWILASPQDESQSQLHQFKTQVTKPEVCLIHCYNVKNQPSISYQYTITHVSTCLDRDTQWTGKAKIRTRNKFLAVGEACVAIFWPTPGFNGRTFVSSELSAEGTLISASAAARWNCYMGKTFFVIIIIIIKIMIIIIIIHVIKTTNLRCFPSLGVRARRFHGL